MSIGSEIMRIEIEQPVCPYLQGSDERCARRFTLHRMSEVFEHCLGEYDRCTIFCQLTINGSPQAAVDGVSHAA